MLADDAVPSTSGRLTMAASKLLPICGRVGRGSGARVFHRDPYGYDSVKPTNKFPIDFVLLL